MATVKTKIGTEESARKQRVEPTGGVTATNTQKALEGLDTGKAPVTSSYLTVAAEATLTGSRRLTLAAALAATDGGAGSTLSIDIATGGVSYAKIQNVAASRLLGNPTGAPAAPSEITLGATLSFSATALQTAALTGDVTASANSFATTIAANVVSYAKFQQVAASSLVGNPTGSLANAQGITLGATLAFSGTALQTAALTSDVTASANSFVTTVAKIQGVTVSGTTGTGNVVFSASPTITGTLSVASYSGSNDLSITKASSALSFSLTASASQVQVNFTGSGGLAYIFTDTAAGANQKNFNLVSSGGVTYFRDLTDLGAVQHTFFTLNQSSGAATFFPATAIPAAGAANTAILLSSTANFGIYFGSNAPTVSAAQGSLYLRSDGSSSSTRAYINTNGTTGWTAITTAA